MAGGGGDFAEVAVVEDAAALGAEKSGDGCEFSHAHGGDGERVVFELEIGEAGEIGGGGDGGGDFEDRGTGGMGGGEGVFEDGVCGERLEIVKRCDAGDLAFACFFEDGGHGFEAGDLDVDEGCVVENGFEGVGSLMCIPVECAAFFFSTGGEQEGDDADQMGPWAFGGCPAFDGEQVETDFRQITDGQQIGSFGRLQRSQGAEASDDLRGV